MHWNFFLGHLISLADHLDLRHDIYEGTLLFGEIS